MRSEIEKIISELFEAVEKEPPIPLAPILRKAIRLATLTKKFEYKAIFHVHLNGVPSDEKENDSTASWPDKTIKPKWDILNDISFDRRVDDKTIDSRPIEEIESVINFSKSNMDKILSSGIKKEDVLELVRWENKFIAVLRRIRNRILAFATKIQEEQFMTTSSGTTNTGLSGNTIFIGHGTSDDWRDLKEFLVDRLNLEYEEFNREATAGMTTIARLEKMLNQSGFAFLVMTAEDEHADGSIHARENVIHEIGLFQGRLGFNRAIVLLEDGCKEFSNIHGLTQLRFPKKKLMSISEEIRRVLEREKII